MVRLARSGLYGSNSEILREALRGLMERERRLALADPPKAYPLVRRYERFGIRRCVHGDHLIFYRLQPEQIEVIHVLQGARDHQQEPPCRKPTDTGLWAWGERSGQGVDGPASTAQIPPTRPLIVYGSLP